jgi:POT family proton-dependent oligopeptide transporter
LLLWRTTLGHVVVELVGVAVVVILIAMALRERGPARMHVFALLVLMVFHTAFWAAFEQVGSSFVVLAETSVDRTVAGIEIPATSLVAVNAALVIALAPLVAWLWRALAERGREPSTALKFSLGPGLLGLGFVTLAAGIAGGLDSGQVGLAPLLCCYLLITIGELCLSPVGLTVVGQLAPKGATSFCMGAWFMTYAHGHLLSGWIATNTVGEAGSSLARQYETFVRVGIAAIVLAGILLMLRRWLTSMIGEFGEADQARGRTQPTRSSSASA